MNEDWQIVIIAGTWGGWHNLGAVESVGLFSPWFTPWMVCVVISFFISTRSEEIKSKAKAYHSARKQAEYGARY